MSADPMTSSTEPTEAVTAPAPMETSVDAGPVPTDDKPVTDAAEEEQAESETKVAKRKRSTKKVAEPVENIANGRPKRNLSKREENPSEHVNGTPKASKTKVEQSNQEEEEEGEDEAEREINIPIVHDVANVVWVKMGGHPWWPSLVIGDPNDSNGSFTKITGNARPKRLYFVVFYGSTADFAWVGDSAVIAYRGVEAFTQYAQEAVDKAVTKHQKEQLTERFQLKVTIGRREDWETAVREADEALKQSSEKRLEAIGPKVQFYTDKFVTSKSQSGRRTKASVTKPDEPARSTTASSEQSKYLSTLDPADRSLLAEKTFEFKSDDEDAAAQEPPPPLRRTPTIKIKLNKQPSNDSDSNPTPPTKRRLLPKSNTVFGQTANGSSVSYEQTVADETTPLPSDSGDLVNGSGSAKKRARPRASQPSASSSNEDSPAPAEFNSVTPSVTTKFTTQRKPIVKPQAFMNAGNGQHDIRTGFLSSLDEQEVLDALEQLGSLKSFEEAEQKAKRRFEHILCVNLNRTHVDIPQEWFYTFLFSHPSIIIKNPQWFNEKNPSNETDLLTDVQSSNSLAVLKHQLVVLSKLYRNQLQARPASSSKKRQSTGKSKAHEEEELLD